MEEHEVAEARRFLKLQDELKNPVLKKAHELSRNKSKEEARRKEVLESWAKFGRYVSQESQQQISEIHKTAQQKRMEEKLKKFM